MIIRLKPAPPHHPGHPAHRPDRLAAPLTNVIDHLHFHDIRHHQPVNNIHHDQPIKKLSSQCAIQHPHSSMSSLSLSNNHHHLCHRRRAKKRLKFSVLDFMTMFTRDDGDMI